MNFSIQISGKTLFQTLSCRILNFENLQRNEEIKNFAEEFLQIWEQGYGIKTTFDILSNNFVLTSNFSK